MTVVESQTTAQAVDPRDLPPITVSDRVEFVRRFLLAYWPSRTVAGDTSGLWSGSPPLPVTWESLPAVVEELTRPRDHEEGLLDDETAQSLCVDRFSPVPSVAMQSERAEQVSSFRQHLRRRLARLRGESIACPEMNAALLAAGHNLAVVICHRLHSSPDLAATRTSVGTFFGRLKERPERFRESHQARLAMWLVDTLLGNHPLFRFDAGAATPIMPDAFERELIAELVGIDPMKAGARCAESKDDGEVTEAEDGFGLWPRVRLQTDRLRDWSDGMLARHRSTRFDGIPTEPYTEAGHSADWLAGWNNRISSARDSDDSFERQLEKGFDGVVATLFAVGRVPQPSGLTAVFEALRQAVSPGRAVNPNVSEGLRTIVRALYHALIPVLGDGVGSASAVASERGVQQVAGDVPALSNILLQPGDIDATWLLLEGIRRQLGDSPDWERLRHQFPESAAVVCQVVAVCPAAWMLSNGLQPTPLETESGRTAMRLFLEAPSLRALRRRVVSEWQRRLLADEADALDSTRSALVACRANETPAGMVLMSEVLRAVFESVIAPVLRELDVASAHGEPVRVAVDDLESAWRQVRVWLDPGPRREWLCDLLQQLIDARRRMSRGGNVLQADRFRRHWQRISSLGTDGLWYRQWPADELQSLRLFWFDVCRRVIDQSDCLPQGLDSGNPDIDQLDRFACSLFSQLVRREVERRDVRGLEHTQIKLRVGDLPEPVQHLLVAYGPLQEVLRVHKLLEAGEAGFEWHINMDAIYPPQSVWSVGPVVIYPDDGILSEPSAG